MYDDYTHFSVLQIMYENYYYEQLAKIISRVKYLIDAYHRYNISRNIFLFCLGSLDSLNYHGVSLNVVFPWFPNCFLLFSLAFPYVSSGVSSVSPQHCFP